MRLGDITNHGLYKFDISTNTKTEFGLAPASDDDSYGYLECINDTVYFIYLDTSSKYTSVYKYNEDGLYQELNANSTKNFINYCVYKNKIYLYTSSTCFIVDGGSYEIKTINLPISSFGIIATENEIFLIDQTVTNNSRNGNNYKSSDGINFAKCLSGIVIESEEGNFSLAVTDGTTASVVDLNDLPRRAIVANINVSYNTYNVTKKENGNILLWTKNNNCIEYEPSDYLILPNIVGVINLKVHEAEDYLNAESNYTYPYIKVLK